MTPLPDANELSRMELPSYGIRRILAATVADPELEGAKVSLIDMPEPDVEACLPARAGLARARPRGHVHLRLVGAVPGRGGAAAQAAPARLHHRVRGAVGAHRALRPAALPRRPRLSRRGGALGRRDGVRRDRPPAAALARGAAIGGGARAAGAGRLDAHGAAHRA